MKKKRIRVADIKTFRVKKYCKYKDIDDFDETFSRS